jgi:hypothetical protein
MSPSPPLCHHLAKGGENMQRQLVISSNLQSVGYDPERKVLEVEFKDDGSIYRYSNVPKNIYDNLMQAPSHGSYFSENIKKHRELYPYVKIR